MSNTRKAASEVDAGRTREHGRGTAQHAIDQADDTDELRRVAKLYAQAILAAREQVEHLLVGCTQCTAAFLRPDKRCAAMRRWQTVVDKAIDAI